MDAYEATRIVFSRIQSLDPENASKIMGLLLIQDHGEKEMIRLAFGPEALVHSIVLKARKDLGLSSSSNSNNNNGNNSVNITNITSLSIPSTPSSPFFSNPISRQNSSSSRMLTNLSPSSSSSPSWVPSNFSDLQHFDELISPNPTSSSASYAAAVAAINGFNNGNSGNTTAVNNNSGLAGNSSDLIDDFQLQDQLSFLNEAASPTIGPKNSDLFYPPPEPVSSPGSNSDGMLFPSYASNWGACAINNGSHRRSSSVTDICMGADPLGSGLGWKPCLYFARGYCKNGTSCRFLHGLPDSAADAGALVGSPNKFDAIEQCQELLLRSKTQQQQQQQVQQQQQQQPQLRLSTASQLMASASFPYSASAAGKCMNFLLQQQQNDTQWAAAAALMLGDDMHKFGRPRIERNEFSSSGGGMVNPGSRQIYLTFPADSTFREEDVSNYFSIYGPVQDVRIPYQQKRMFGFVTFVYPETVKLILAKGNPHFVCDARVLVKPYKEKGKVPDKYRKQQQQQQPADRGDFSACTTPTGIDSRDSYDLQLGGRTFNNTQDFLRRKLEEQADLQQAIELQSRRFLGLQLLDVKKHQRNLSTGAISIPSPTQHPFSPHFNSHASSIFPSSFTDPDRASPETPQDHQQQQQEALNMNKNQEEFNQSENGKGSGNGNGDQNVKSGSIDDCGGSAGGFHSSLEHNLPDSPFASPKKSNGEPPSISNTVVAEIERSNGTVSSASSSSSSTSFLPSSSSSNKNLVASSLLPATSTLDMASFKSCLLQVPRFPSGHGALGM